MDREINTQAGRQTGPPPLPRGEKKKKKKRNKNKHKEALVMLQRAHWSYKQPVWQDVCLDYQHRQKKEYLFTRGVARSFMVGASMSGDVFIAVHARCLYSNHMHATMSRHILLPVHASCANKINLQITCNFCIFFYQNSRMNHP